MQQIVMRTSRFAVYADKPLSLIKSLNLEES